MRRFVLASVVVLTACSTAPISYSGTSPTPAGTAYGCAMREINRLGYTVVNTDRDGGFITATKQTSGLGTALLVGKKYSDVLTVSVFGAGDAGAGNTTLRVTTGRTAENALTFGAASKTTTAPSESGKNDAQSLLHACTRSVDAVVTDSATTVSIQAPVL